MRQKRKLVLEKNIKYPVPTYYSKKGPIHRIHFYVLDSSVPRSWSWPYKSKTGHWWMHLGRVMFSTM